MAINMCELRGCGLHEAEAIREGFKDAFLDIEFTESEFTVKDTVVEALRGLIDTNIFAITSFWLDIEGFGVKGLCNAIYSIRVASCEGLIKSSMNAEMYARAHILRAYAISSIKTSLLQDPELAGKFGIEDTKAFIQGLEKVKAHDVFWIRNIDMGVEDFLKVFSEEYKVYGFSKVM